MTKKVKRNILKNIFLEYEKEENWLNNMCKQGYALSEITNNYYHFKACEPGEFSYRIEFLKEERIPEKDTYLGFMNEMEIEHIAAINRWQYFRRKAILGEFTIYSDIKSKIEHYQRINIIWYILAVIFILPAFFLLSDLIASFFMKVDINLPGALMNIALLTIGLFFLKKALPLTKKISALKNDQNLYD
ncbi:DUF2812 domain-containing protein [Sutcliffiella halmapala]|uniref:DUF2812 domain-containing protein n=1 Tax=Sutcliffiella halmapala TaxID=79882 RepID=UPI0009955C8D|nr:DUF2812 domain-containing protein [Sutcliffiella halmapala]